MNKLLDKTVVLEKKYTVKLSLTDLEKLLGLGKLENIQVERSVDMRGEEYGPVREVVLCFTEKEERKL